MTRYAEVIRAYARQVGLSEQELLSNQELVIAGVAIGLASEGDQDTGDMILFSTLGRPAAEVDSEQLMRLMLEANGLWVGTGGCTLGLQAGTGAVLLCARLALNALDAGALSNALQGFTDVALIWREVVQGKVATRLPNAVV